MERLNRRQIPEYMEKVTYSELVQLKQDSKLKPGLWYRITDYEFITHRNDIQSGGHPFDILVLALSESSVSEEAKAMPHEGDTYFSTQALTWDPLPVIYDIYVDNQFLSGYAEEGIHEPIYKLEDKFIAGGTAVYPPSGEEVPVIYKTDDRGFDPFNIDYEEFNYPDTEDTYFYVGQFEFEDDLYDRWDKWANFWDEEQQKNVFVFCGWSILTPVVVNTSTMEIEYDFNERMEEISKPLYAWELKYTLENNPNKFDWAETDGKGVIYYMKDDYGNEAPYDFKNVKFKRYKQNYDVLPTYLNILEGWFVHEGAQLAEYDEQDYDYLYTFVSNEIQYPDDVDKDGSLDGSCSNNKITSIGNGLDIKRLNNLVLFNAHWNIFDNCTDCTIREIEKNTLKQCYNIWGYSLYENDIRGFVDSDVCATSRNELYDISSFYSRELNQSHIENSWEVKFQGYGNQITNITMKNCYNVTFFDGENSYNELISSSNINLYRESRYNTINYCNNINLGVGSSYNNFKQRCHDITLGSQCLNNNFDGYCEVITLGSFCQYNNFNNHCKNFTLNLTRHSDFGNCCEGINLYSDCEYIVIGNNARNITFEGSANAKVQNCIIQPGVYNIKLIPSSQYARLKNVTVCTGVKGNADSINITPVANVEYPQVYYSSNEVRNPVNE